jgi:DNA-binding transcriptional ArsR family regulator
MEMENALAALSALSHETRLATFRTLVEAGPDGLPAGVIAGRLGVLANTMSSHLAQLSRAGLVRTWREGRVVRYAADYAGMRDLMAFLIKDCCGGQPEICAPLAAIASECAACAASDDGRQPAN